MNDTQFLDICRFEFEKVKAELKSGAKPPHALIIVGSSRGELVGGKIVMEGGHVNSDAMEKIGESFVRDLRIRAEMVVHIGDAWYVEADDRQEGVSPSEHPNRKHAVTFNGIMREGRGVVGFLPYDVTDDGRLALVMDDAQEPVKLVEVTTSEAQYVGDDRYKLYDRLVSAFLAGVEQAEGGAIVGGLLE